MIFSTLAHDRKQLKKIGLIAAALLIPASFALYLALTSSPTSVRDYWEIMEVIYSTKGFSTNLSNWFISQNGHIVFIPRLIYVVNMFVTNGSNIGLTVTAWFLAMVQAILLVWLIPPEIRDTRVRLIAVVAISGFSFAPTATDNWMHGFSGVHWILANVLSIGAIICLTQFFREDGYGWVIACFVLAGLALITYGTAIGLWLALIAAFVIMRSKLHVGAVAIILTALVIAISFASRPLVPPSTVSWLDRVIIFIPYLAIFIGGVFTLSIPLAFVIGIAGLIAGTIIFFKFGIQAKQSIRLTVLPWLLVLVYSLVNIAFIAITRLEFGLAYATTMRYVTLSGLYWIVILVMWAYHRYCSQDRYTWSALAPYMAIVSLLLLVMLPLGLDRAQRITRHAEMHPPVILSINLNIPDEPLVDQAITIHERSFLNQVPALKDDGLIPFNTLPQKSCGQPGEQLDLTQVDATTPIPGDFEFLDPITPDGARAIGWLETTPNSIECIILANQSGIIRGKALFGFARPDLPTDAKIGWIGYTYLDHTDETLTVYAKLVNSTAWTPLPQTRSRSNPGEVRIEVYTGMVGNIHDEHIGLEQFNTALRELGYTPPATDLRER